MNDLMKMTEPTMGTREIADLIHKQHANIKISAERLAEKGVIGTLAPQEFIHNGNAYEEYRINKRDSLILVAQNCPEFTAAIVDRWQALEAMQKPALPSTYLDALKELVAAVESKQALEAENGVLRPKALIVDRINDAEGLHTMAEAAKILGTGRTRLFQFLRQEHIFDVHNMPLQQYIPNRFVVKERPYMRGDERSIYAQVYVTGRGIVWLTPKVAGLGPDGQGEFFE